MIDLVNREIDFDSSDKLDVVAIEVRAPTVAPHDLQTPARRFLRVHTC